MKVVLDTNVILISLPTKSKFRPILDAILSGKLTLVVSNEIIYEYQEVIERKANSNVAKNVVEMLLSLVNIEKKEIFFQWDLIKADKDDNKFVDCAISGNADYIVTNDKHFNVLKTLDFPKVEVININQFMDILGH